MRLFPALALCAFVLGCSDSDSGPQLYPVTGTVIVDGEPLQDGTINFEPADGLTGTYGSRIQAGKFQFDAAAGPKRVSISAFRPSASLGPDGKPMQEQYLPPKYNVKTELTAEVTADGENTFPFDLKTK